MCGINGFNSEDRDLIRAMNAALSHRGPDGDGLWSDDGVTLGHLRLAIIDLSEAAAQPMVSADGNLVITYNGELYNFRELRRELSAYPYRTECDTEVVLAAYEAWGPSCVERFNGIFAFAVWDRRQRELFLARDHVGVKPLFYFHDGRQFVFSSEIKGLLEHPGVPRRLSRTAFLSYFRLLYAPGPETMLEGIRKLAPGHRMVLKDGDLSIERYFSLYAAADEEETTGDGFSEAAAGLREVIVDACDRQLVSDRPVGLYLSGGIDSSSVLAATVARRGSDVDTYSVGFALSKDEEEEKFNADFLLARRTAKHFGTRHHEYMLSSDEALSLLEDAVWHVDDPVSNPTVLAQMALARFTKPTATVVLLGDGGDELFGGYDRYRLALLSERYRRLVPGVLRSRLSRSSRLAKLNTPPGSDHIELFLFQKDPALAQALRVPLSDDTTVEHFRQKFFSDSASVPAAEALMRVDRESWLVDEALTRTDRTTMAAGVEGRVPLLDREVVAYAMRLPLGYRLTPFATKRVLKAAFRDTLPSELFSQPKRGWFSPAAKWLRHPKMQDAVKDVLSSEYHPATADLFDWRGIEQALSEHIDKRGYHLNALWALVTFQMWARQHGVVL